MAMTPVWAPKRIRMVDRVLGTSTGAARVETDVGPAFAKLPGNPEGLSVLCCELIGTRAAQWLGLPTFDFALIPVTERLIQYDNGTESLAGTGLLMREELGGQSWGGTSEELASVVNQDALSGLIVLDTWLLNCDRFSNDDTRMRRNERNVFLIPAPGRKE